MSINGPVSLIVFASLCIYYVCLTYCNVFSWWLVLGLLVCALFLLIAFINIAYPIWIYTIIWLCVLIYSFFREPAISLCGWYVASDNLFCQCYCNNTDLVLNNRLSAHEAFGACTVCRYLVKSLCTRYECLFLMCDIGYSLTVLLIWWCLGLGIFRCVDFVV